ncbi:MAG: lipoyl(octanoyl) transferase LipB [Actinobacteria bacterium]|nr:lipoyl(octanoyl) transferase LipB [Actinomycetota bacterium]
MPRARDLLTPALMRTGRLIVPEAPVPYGPAYEWMHRVASDLAAGHAPDTLLLLQHPPVYTAGRRSDPSHLVSTEDEIRASGAELHFVDRGGSVTYHGPGQLVGYPILDLGLAPDVIAYLRKLEEVVIRASRTIGVRVHRDPERTGVWAGDRKVCAIGVKLAHARVTLHGFALNCTTDLAWFDAIVPCGLSDRGVVTLSDLARREVTVEEMAPLVAGCFEEVFGLRLLAERATVQAQSV